MEIAKELNLGQDSLVFLDDDPMNRDLVREQLTDILVPDFSLDAEHYTKTLYSLSVFMPFAITEEDKKKGEMYHQEKERNKVLTSAKNFDEYVKNLEIEIKISENSKDQIQRISQMTLKTNQFNFTTKRYSEKEIENAFNLKFSYDEAMSVKDFFDVLKLVSSKGGDIK
ncbi:MAG: hypothetical protein NTV72_03535 [Candidatus Taylorbacteria bacterium]|nr:hypothetical protein [Candidatus Taylorbacteria bacterium]